MRMLNRRVRRKQIAGGDRAVPVTLAPPLLCRSDYCSLRTSRAGTSLVD